MKAAIYCRVSTEVQEHEGTSLDSQMQACVKAAQERGYEVTDDYAIREVWSGLTLDRPKLTTLRKWVQDGEVGAVVVYSTDRLSRDPLHLLLLAEEFDKAKVPLLFVTEPLDNSMEGQLLGFVRGWASKLEAIKIKERTSRGQRMRAMSGKLPGGRHTRLYGYHYVVGKGDGQGIRIINEEETKWVREMFRWLVEEGLSVTAITMRLRGLGISNSSGTSFWSRSTVYQMLTNPAYIGKTYAFTKALAGPQKHPEPQKHRQQSPKQPSKRTKTYHIWRPREEWLEIPNATPPIISEELYEAAQARLVRNKRLSSRHAKRQYLLSGYIHCRQCGRLYWGVTSGCSGGVRQRYACANRSKMVAPVPCKNGSLRAEYLDRLVWQQVEKVLTEPEVVIAELQRRRQIAEADGDDKNFDERLKSIDKQLGSLQDREFRLVRLYTFGEFDDDTLRKEKQAIDTQRRRLEDEKLQLERRIEVQRQCTASIDGLASFCALVSQNIGQFSFEDKRLALEALQIKVWIDGDKVTIEGAVPVDGQPVEGHNEQRIVSTISR